MYASSINELHALCEFYASQSIPQSSSFPLDFHDMKIEDKIHEVFIRIWLLIRRSDSRGKDDQTLGMLRELKSILTEHPFLCDARKRGILLRMADMFKRFNLPFHREKMLGMVSNIASASSAPLNEDPYLLLPESLLQTSNIISQVLAKRWRQISGDDTLPLDLQFPCLHRAAQFQNEGVVLAVLVHQHDFDVNPSLRNEQRALVVNTLNSAQGFAEPIQARLDIDARDAFGRTALHLAASNGFKNVCSALIRGLADPNARDHQMHTVLEMAAGGGHFDIVVQLLEVGADLNPDMAWGTLSPLQAAIESANFNYELVQYLVAKGANMYDCRLHDQKSAIQIASENGHDLMALTSSPQNLPPAHSSFLGDPIFI